MNINPDKVKQLMLLFAALDNDYQKELLDHAYTLKIRQIQKKLIKEEGKNYKNKYEYEDEFRRICDESANKVSEIVELYNEADDNGKAQITIFLDKLCNGELAKKTDIEIRINSKKVSIKDYIEEILPQANFQAANEVVTKYLKEENKI